MTKLLHGLRKLFGIQHSHTSVTIIDKVYIRNEDLKLHKNLHVVYWAIFDKHHLNRICDHAENTFKVSSLQLHSVLRRFIRKNKHLCF